MRQLSIRTPINSYIKNCDDNILYSLFERIIQEMNKRKEAPICRCLDVKENSCKEKAVYDINTREFIAYLPCNSAKDCPLKKSEKQD